LAASFSGDLRIDPEVSACRGLCTISRSDVEISNARTTRQTEEGAVGETVDTPPKAVPLKVTNPERIPARRYYDEAFFKLEAELLWPRVWQMACRLEEIPEVGDWVEYKILDRSVIVIRSKSGVKAYHNHCRHRGVQLASGHGNCEVQGFTCPFHGWRWNIDGECTFVYGRHLFREEALDGRELALVPCRVEFWGGCAFINFDDDAPPLLECIKPLTERLDPLAIDKMRVEWWCSVEVPCNWKLAMEAFMESYHVKATHPQFYAASMPGGEVGQPDRGAAHWKNFKTGRQVAEASIRMMESLNQGMAGMCHANDLAVGRELLETIELPDGDPMAALGPWFGAWNAAITERARARGAAMPNLNELAMKPAGAVQFLFPHYFMLPTFGNISSYRVRPLGPETCLFEIWSLTHWPADEAHERPRAATVMALDDARFPEIPPQDYSNLPFQQLGLHSKGFEYMRLSPDVEGLISNYQRLIDGYLGGVGQDQLVKGYRVASGELDDAIGDIGF
jgi:phenylpropionate dioxygenase-like ring-hydroxylating dioxygenase large terminal subunit